MNSNDFFNLCEKEFDYLFVNYNFKIIKKVKESWGYRIYLKNNTTGIIITYELRECFVFIQLCKLENGEFVKDEGEMRPDSILYNFYYEDLLSIKSPESIFPKYSNETILDDELLKRLVKHHADKIKEYSIDIINGDFTIFSELDKIVKERAKKAAIKKWGKDAIKYGWK